jgi:hypothetical protein
MSNFKGWSKIPALGLTKEAGTKALILKEDFIVSPAS